MVSDTPPPPEKARIDAGVATSPTTPAPDAAGVVPAVTVGAGLAPVAFAPGRYASAIQVSTSGTHDLQLVSEVATTVFILELAGDGSATACRGWRYKMNNDGPDVHTSDHQEVQQGYRGRYVANAGVAEIDLDLDDTVCAAHAASRPFVRGPLKLRAVLVAPHGHAMLKDPALFCEWVPPGVPLTNPGAHAIPDLAPKGWFVLGTGNGLRAKITGTPTDDFEGDPTRVVLSAAPAPIATDSWKQSF